MIANILGSLVVFNTVGFLLPLFVEEAERNRLGYINAALVAALFIIVMPLMRRSTRPLVERMQEWLETGADPLDARHTRTLRSAILAAELTGIVWIVVALISAVVNAFLSSLTVGIAIGVTVALGGLTTSGLLYLMAERRTRQLTAVALAAGLPNRPVTPGIRARLLAAWMLSTAVPLLGIVALAIGGWIGSKASITELSTSVLFICVVALVSGLVATFYAGGSIAEPVGAVRQALGRVERGDLDAEVRVDDGSEVGLLQVGFNRMATGLRERERLRDLFGRHVGRDVAQRALEVDLELGGEAREIAALFVDITGSTTLASERPPTEVVELLNSFFAVVVEAVEAHGGLVNKFEGDAALAIFGAPVDLEDPGGCALTAAREMADRLRSEVSSLDFGIGVSAGEAVAGNVGAEERYEYTVIGDPVNEAARVCELAKAHEGRVLASDAAVERARGDEVRHWRLGASVTLRGRAAETRLAAPAT